MQKTGMFLTVAQLSLLFIFFVWTVAIALGDHSTIHSMPYRVLAITHYSVTIMLQLWCLVDLWRRKLLAFGPKLAWATGIIVLGFFVAPLYYFIVGRTEKPSPL